MNYGGDKMKCPNCGNEIPDDSLFCNKCGTEIIQEREIQLESEEQSVEKNQQYEENIYNNNNRKRKIIKIVTLSLGILLIIVGILFCFVIPAITKESDYQQLKDLINNKKYSEASVKVAELGNYKDSDNLSKEIKYCTAKDYFAKGQFTDAIKIYSELGNYKDSADMKKTSENCLKQKEQEDAQQQANQKAAQQQTTDKENLKNELYKLIDSCPLEVSRQQIAYNSIGEALSSVTAKNNSNKTIDAFKIYIYCYDNFNKPVNHYAYNTNIFTGIKQDKIRPNESISCKDYDWTMHGFDNTTKIQAIVKEIHYTDNTSWVLDDKYQNVLQEFVDKLIVDAKFS